MTALFPRATCAAAAALALAGCVAQDGFPSLEPRTAEREDAFEEPVRAATEAASDAALRERVESLLAAAARGDRAFEAALPAAAAAAQAAGAAESESWILAQQALSRLQAAREETTRALADLDRLAVERADRPTAAGDRAAIESALAEAARVAGRQQARVDALRAQLSGR